MSVEIGSMESLVALHALATWYMVGLIWFVQVVHYPGFSSIPREGFGDYANRHVRRTGWVVGPPMLVEVATAGLLVFYMPHWLTFVGALLLAVVWASTALLQVPAHDRLCSDGYDEAVIQRLVKSNWLRTAAWSLRGVVAAALMLSMLNG